jgi:protein transport protein SEC61 subunit gamma and related proteins
MNLITKLKSFIEKCKRVWMVLKKPTKEEFRKIALVSAVGILVIGVIGFLISIIVKMITG